MPRHFPNLFGNVERWVIRENYSSSPLDLIIGCNSKYKALCVEDKQISLGVDYKIAMQHSPVPYFTWTPFINLRRKYTVSSKSGI